jgi:hypothetical protein
MSDGAFAKAVSGVSIENMAGPYQGRLIPSVTVIDTRAAMRVSDGLEALCLVVDQKSITTIREWPASEGFEVEILPEDPGSPKSKLQVILQSTDRRFREVFFALCEDICGMLDSAENEEAAVRAFQSRLVKWQSFFKKGRSDGLSPEHQVGLFGELHVMKDILLKAGVHSTVLKAWRGCLKANQDFQFKDWALEVKTSRAVIVDKVSISNVQQLDEDGKSPMVLTVVHVHANRTSGTTLPAVIRELRQGLIGEASELFEQGLFEVGFLDIHAEAYEDTKYQILGMNHYEVKEGFPRLCRADLPDGIKKVKYDISIDAARGFRVSEESVYELAHRTDNNKD